MKIRPGEAGLFIVDRRTDRKTERHDVTEREIIYNRKTDFDFCLQVIITIYLHEWKILNFMKV